VECVDMERMLFSRAEVCIIRLLCDLDLALECVDRERVLFSRPEVVIALRKLGLDLVGDETSWSPAGSCELVLPERMACMVDGPSHSSTRLHFFNFGS
jgi:hypothetical protein